MRKCNETEQEKIYRCIALEPEINLFIYGDLETYGFSSPQVSVYVEDDGSESYDSLVLRYFDYYIIYSQHENYALEPVIDFFRGRENVESISGKMEILKPLVSYFPKFQFTTSYMCRCNSIAPINPTSEHTAIQKLIPEDAPKIVELYVQIEEFASNYRGKEDEKAEEIRSNLSDGGIAYGVFEGHKLVSVGYTSGANSKSAMIIGIATLPGFRKKGFASLVVQMLCQESFEEGKDFLCLFYHNPEAGRIYHKIGFQEVGQYATLR